MRRPALVDPVTELLDEFIVRYRRGEDPNLRDYLARAGDRADELGLLVEGVLRAVPPPEPSEESVALARAWVAGQPPLLELRVERGRTYSVPYRVVVFKVTEWTGKEYFQGLRFDEPLPEDWDGSLSGPEDEVVTRFHLEQVLGTLPERERQVAEARWVRALEPDEIAAELDIERNNVYQALSRAKGKLAAAGVA